MSRQHQAFDPASVSAGTWIALAGAVALLVAPFLDWYRIAVSVAGVTVTGSRTGWQSTDLARVVMVLGALALVVVALDVFARELLPSAAAGPALLALGTAAALLVAFRVLDQPIDTHGVNAVSVSTAGGIWVSLAAAGVLGLGGWLRLGRG
jgi:hypothetical protein